MSLRSLEKIHGEYIQLAGPSNYLFSDGTHVSGDRYLTIHGATDPTDGRRQFLMAKLKQEIVNWKHFKDDCEEQHSWHLRNPSNCPGPPANAKKQLLAGKGRIEKIRVELAEMNEEHGPDPVEKLQRRRNEKSAEHRQRVSEFWQEVCSVSID